RTTPQEFTHLDFVQPFVSSLREHSANRVAANRDYAYILEDIDELKKRKEDPSVSLNESKRLVEKKDRKAREEARKKEHKELEPHRFPVRELTLEAVEKGEPPKLLGANKTGSNGDRLPAVTPSGDEDDSDADDTEEHLDPQLRESLNILSDYIDQLTAKGQR